MTGKRVERKERNVDRQDERADTNSKMALEKESADGVVPKKNDEQNREIEKVAMDVLEDERKRGFPAIIAAGRLATSDAPGRSAVNRRARGKAPRNSSFPRRRAAWRIRQNRRERRRQRESRSTRRHGARCCRDGIPARETGNQTSGHLRSGCSVVKNDRFSNEILGERRGRECRRTKIHVLHTKSPFKAFFIIQFKEI